MLISKACGKVDEVIMMAEPMPPESEIEEIEKISRSLPDLLEIKSKAEMVKVLKQVDYLLHELKMRAMRIGDQDAANTLTTVIFILEGYINRAGPSPPLG